MKKSTALGFCILLVALGGIIFYVGMKPLPEKAIPSAETLALPASGDTEHAAYYEIAPNYPSSTPLAAEANVAAIKLMQAFISDTITQFKTDGNFANLTAADVRAMGFDKGRKEKLQINYLISSSSHTVSYIFTTYEDTLGAHGNLFFHTFTFDTSTGASLSLADLFEPGTSYLDTLSSISRAKLPEVIGDAADTGFITRGTTSEDKNFENFFLDNQSLVILFDPYAVAPYSSGPQTLRIPVSELSSILKPSLR